MCQQLISQDDVIIAIVIGNPEFLIDICTKNRTMKLLPAPVL